MSGCSTKCTHYNSTARLNKTKLFRCRCSVASAKEDKKQRDDDTVFVAGTLYAQAYRRLSLLMRQVRPEVPRQGRLHEASDHARGRPVYLRRVWQRVGQQDVPLFPQELQAPREGRQVPVPGVQEEVADAEEPGQPRAAARAEVHVRGVRRGADAQGFPEEAHQDALWREAVPLPYLRQDLCERDRPQSAPPHARGGASVRLHNMRPELHAAPGPVRSLEEEASGRHGGPAACVDQEYHRVHNAPPRRENTINVLFASAT